MVPKKSRLPTEGFRARGYRAMATPFFSLKTKQNGLDVNRIGVVVGKSVDKRAARRNFLERQVKAALLRVPNTGKDILMIVFPKANTLIARALTQELEAILKKI